MKKSGRAWLVRTLAALLGVAILALGATILRVGLLGLDPFTASNIGMGAKFGLSLGVYQLGVNLIMAWGIFIFGRKYIGLGTVINMVLAGFFIDLMTPLLESFHFSITLASQAVFLVIGIFLFSLGTSFYMSADLGSAPYDALAPVIVDHTNWPYRVVRVIQDLAFVTLAFFAGGPIGVGTVITAFFMGPLIGLWNKFSVKWINQLAGE